MQWFWQRRREGCEQEAVERGAEADAAAARQLEWEIRERHRPGGYGSPEWREKMTAEGWYQTDAGQWNSTASSRQDAIVRRLYAIEARLDKLDGETGN